MPFEEVIASRTSKDVMVMRWSMPCMGLEGRVDTPTTSTAHVMQSSGPY